MSTVHSEIDRLFAAGEHKKAMRVIEHGLAQNPHDTNLYRAYGRLNQILGNLPRAEQWLAALVKHSPPRYADLFDYTAVLNEQSKYPQVIEQLNRAELIKKTDPMLYLRRGGAHWEMRDWARADADFKQALSLDPKNADAMWVNGLLDLQLGRFSAGWERYDARWRSQRFKSNRLITSKPQWSPNSNLRRVLLWGEQGVGDQIFYASALRHLQSLTDKVTMLIDARLIPLFERSFPAVNFLPNTAEVSVEEHDSHLPIASLLAQFVHSIEDIAKYTTRNYLQPDAVKVAALRAKLPQGKPIIGLSWTSNAVKIGPHKSVPLEFLEPLLSDRFNFVNLQYAQSSTEKVLASIIRAPVNCHMDLEGLAALLAVCDLVVAVSSTTVHLAAAQGRPVLLLDANKLWYWGNRDENNVSYWYPSVQVFPRDHVLASWSGVVEQVRTELERRYPDGH